MEGSETGGGMDAARRSCAGRLRARGGQGQVAEPRLGAALRASLCRR